MKKGHTHWSINAALVGSTLCAVLAAGCIAERLLEELRRRHNLEMIKDRQRKGR